MAVRVGGAPVFGLDPERQLATLRLRIDAGQSVSPAARLHLARANMVALEVLVGVAARAESEEES